MCLCEASEPKSDNGLAIRYTASSPYTVEADLFVIATPIFAGSNHSPYGVEDAVGAIIGSLIIGLIGTVIINSGLI